MIPNRTRDILVEKSETGRWQIGVYIPYTDWTAVRRQSTYSVGHPVSLIGNGDDIGGPFLSETQTLTIDGPGVIDAPYMYWGGRGIPLGHQYRAGFDPDHWPASAERRSVTAILGDGATAIARSKPTNPIFSAATFLGELREGLPKIVGTQLFKEKVSRARAAGSEYLNSEFGWKPMISDFTKFTKGMAEFQKRTQQLQRDSGKTVRRNWDFPTITEETTTHPSPQFIALGKELLNLYQQQGFSINDRVESRERKTWFSGAFTYYVPPVDELGGILHYESMLNSVLGTRITPEVLWNLAPWSWAVDWFSNSGDVISNLSSMATDGLCLRYGYIMEQTSHVIRHQLKGQIQSNSGLIPYETTLTIGEYRKVRYRATPFGFSTVFGDLTPRQIAIAGALGLSNMPARP